MSTKPSLVGGFLLLFYFDVAQVNPYALCNSGDRQSSTVTGNWRLRIMGRQAKLKRERKEGQRYQSCLEQIEQRNAEIDKHLINLSLILVPMENNAGYFDAWSNLKDIDKPTAFRLAAEIHLALVHHLNEDRIDSKTIMDRRKRTFGKGQDTWISVGTHLLFAGAKDYISEEELLKIPIAKKYVKTEPYLHIQPLSDMLLALYNLVEELHRRGIFDKATYPSHNFAWLLAVGAIANQMLFESGVLNGSTSPYFPEQPKHRTKKQIYKNAVAYFNHLLDNPPATKTAQNLFEEVAHLDKVIEFKSNELASNDESFRKTFWKPYVDKFKEWTQQIQMPFFKILDVSTPGDRRGRKIGSKNKH
jgi:hypothetical protein